MKPGIWAAQKRIQYMQHRSYHNIKKIVIKKNQENNRRTRQKELQQNFLLKITTDKPKPWRLN